MPVVVRAIQEQQEELDALLGRGEKASLPERFAQRVKAAIPSLSRLFVPAVATSRLCLDDLGITRAELKELLEIRQESGATTGTRTQPKPQPAPSPQPEPVIEEKPTPTATTMPRPPNRFRKNPLSRLECSDNSSIKR